jgi:ribosomal protein S18 acetylase RimI-like enzyme
MPQTAHDQTTRLSVRRYREGDHDAVWALHNVALHHVGAHVGNGPWDDDLHRVAETYLEGGGEFLVGEADGAIVAMGALRRRDATRGDITRMRVHPTHQRRGVGRAILAALEARAVELGYTTLFLDTTEQQTAAQRLYESSGYQETGRAEQFGFRVIHYRKQLPPAPPASST